MLRNKASFLLILVALSVIAQVAFGQSPVPSGGGQIDFTFRMTQTYPPEEGSFPELITQPDGKILAVGKFSVDTYNLSARKLYRFLPNGQRDLTFIPYYPYPNIRIENTAIQSDGKILYLFTILDDQRYTTLNVIRLNEDGSQDTSFNYVPYYRTRSFSFIVLPLADGTTMISGGFVERGDFPASRSMLKLNADGSYDRNFIVNYTSGSGLMHQLPNRKILLLGSNVLKRLNNDGTIDPSFIQQSDVRNFSVLPDQKIIVSTTNNGLQRLFPNGDIDNQFNSLPSLSNFQFVLRSDGEIILTNYQCLSFVNCRTYFEHLSSDGSLKRRFDSRLVKGRLSIDSTDNLYIQGEMLIDRTKVGLVKIRTEYTPTREKAFDFNGDGKSDISVYRPSEGNWYIFNAATNALQVVRFGIAEDKPVPADYDGDNIADIAVYRPSAGTWYIFRSSDGLVSTTRFGLAEDIPTQNDYDGDGKADISLFRPSNGNWYRINSSNGSVSSREFGTSDARPIPGDYDGDGIADFAYWAVNSRTWHQISSISGSQYDGPVNLFENDLAAPADFDGDSRVDRALFKSHNGSWYGTYSLLGSGFYFLWGQPGDIPVPADYDGDGKDDFAVWRPSTGEWWVGQSSNGQFYAYPFGQAGDIPIPSTFTR